MYNTKFVQKLAFAYRNCPLSLETTKHFQTYMVFIVRCFLFFFYHLMMIKAAQSLLDSGSGSTHGSTQIICTIQSLGGVAQW